MAHVDRNLFPNMSIELYILDTFPGGGILKKLQGRPYWYKCSLKNKNLFVGIMKFLGKHKCLILVACGVT